MISKSNNLELIICSHLINFENKYVSKVFEKGRVSAAIATNLKNRNRNRNRIFECENKTSKCFDRNINFTIKFRNTSSRTNIRIFVKEKRKKKKKELTLHCELMCCRT